MHTQQHSAYDKHTISYNYVLLATDALAAVAAACIEVLQDVKAMVVYTKVHCMHILEACQLQCLQTSKLCTVNRVSLRYNYCAAAYSSYLTCTAHTGSREQALKSTLTHTLCIEQALQTTTDTSTNS
jgi:hypothetical protein